jgi:DNA invertase Pin-like site-specific DNA recombinase
MLIGYARVSTDDQLLDLQLDALQRAGCERVYTETASGSRLDRPELAKAIADLRDGDAFMVWKLDRLGRTVHQLVDLVRTLADRGVAFRSITDTIDTSTPAGRMFFHMMAALAEMERDLIRERTNAGLVAARARGKVGGRRPKLAPHQIEQARLLMSNPKESASRVAATFGIDRSTLYRLLRQAADASLVGSDTARPPRTASQTPSIGRGGR